MEGHFPSEGGEPSLGQWFARAGDPSARATALGTDDGLGLVGAGPGIDADMLLEQPGGEVPAELDGPLLPLVKGDELILVLRIEHQVEGGCGVGQPALAKSCAWVLGLGSRVAHGRPPGDRVNRTRIPGHHIPAAGAQERDCTLRVGRGREPGASSRQSQLLSVRLTTAVCARFSFRSMVPLSVLPA
jgi:hypothetical protein